MYKIEFSTSIHSTLHGCFEFLYEYNVTLYLLEFCYGMRPVAQVYDFINFPLAFRKKSSYSYYRYSYKYSFSRIKYTSSTMIYKRSYLCPFIYRKTVQLSKKEKVKCLCFD